MPVTHKNPTAGISTVKSGNSGVKFCEKPCWFRGKKAAEFHLSSIAFEEAESS